MSIDRKTIEKLAQLAKLSINEADLQKYQSHLSPIVDLIDIMSSAKTDHVSPMAHPLEEMIQRLRDDEITESDHHLVYQELSQSAEAGLYLVPAVIEGA